MFRLPPPPGILGHMGSTGMLGMLVNLLNIAIVLTYRYRMKNNRLRG